MKHILSPSLLSADFSILGKEIEMLNQSQADWLHLDIMDGVFVPNISFGFPIIKYIQKYAKKPLDVHLMIVEPNRYLKQFIDCGAYMLTVHYEACKHLHRTIQEIKQLNCKAGVSLNPHTPVALLKDIIQDLDMVLIMSVNPGFGGQQFIENTYNKVKELRELINSKNANCMIQIDGGVDLNNYKKLVNIGVDVLVAGSAVFKADNPLDMIHQLKTI